MKKSLFIFAAAALALTACTSDNEATQTATQKAAPQAIAFDTYVPNASATRVGDAGLIQTTTTLQADGKGFGVFAYHHDNNGYAADLAAGSMKPNFMYNEHVTYNSSAWSYSPVKYWPNETEKDNQDPLGSGDGSATSTGSDKLSFFAYAPYAAPNSTASLAAKGELDGVTYSADPTISDAKTDEVGIQAVIANNGTVGPWVRYKIADNPANSVDLLWGVAPAGGLQYQSVNPTDNATYNIDRAEGMPLIDLVKPANDQKIKFLFKHALARIGMSVVAAIDQIAPGGKFETYDHDSDPATPEVPKTKIFVESVTLSEVNGTNLYKLGTLNLKNTNAGEALWSDKSGAFTGLSVATTSVNSDILYTTDAGTSWAVEGVTTKEKQVIASNKYFMVIPSHANTTLQVTITYHVCTMDDKLVGGYSDVTNVITKKVTITKLTNNKAYNLKLILGLSSVKLDAEVAEWQIDGSTEFYLPQNK